MGFIVTSDQRKKDLLKLVCYALRHIETHHIMVESQERQYLGLHWLEPLERDDVQADILTELEYKMRGDDGEGPCWSSEQRKYAQELWEALPDAIQHFPDTFEFYKEGYHDADGIAYDYGVQRAPGLQAVVAKHRREQDQRIRDLESVFSDFAIERLEELLEKVKSAKAKKEKL